MNYNENFQEQCQTFALIFKEKLRLKMCFLKLKKHISVFVKNYSARSNLVSILFNQILIDFSCSFRSMIDTFANFIILPNLSASI